MGKRAESMLGEKGATLPSRRPVPGCHLSRLCQGCPAGERNTVGQGSKISVINRDLYFKTYRLPFGSCSPGNSLWTNFALLRNDKEQCYITWTVCRATLDPLQSLVLTPFTITGLFSLLFHKRLELPVNRMFSQTCKYQYKNVQHVCIIYSQSRPLAL